MMGLALALALVDGLVMLFSAVMVVAVPLIDAQACLPSYLYPAALVELKHGYDLGDYLMAESPPFFVGLVWTEIVFIWPLSFANIYGILTAKPWVATTSLMVGVCKATSMAILMGELLGSGRGSSELLQMHAPFVLFALLAILRGLISRPYRTTASSSAYKKKA